MPVVCQVAWDKGGERILVAPVLVVRRTWTVGLPRESRRWAAVMWVMHILRLFALMV